MAASENSTAIAVRTPAFKGEWQVLFDQTLADLLQSYGQRGPQYRMLSDLAAGLYVQIKRMEATGAIRGLETIDQIIAMMRERGETYEHPMLTEDQAMAMAARTEIANAEKAIKVYLGAMEEVRKLIDQAQRYTEAKKAEIVVTEVDLALHSALLIVQTHVDERTFVEIIREIKSRIGESRT